MADKLEGKKAASSPTGAPPTGKKSQSPTNQNSILPAEHWLNTPNDHEYEIDADSTLGTDAASSTQSLTSSIIAYRTINGRTYHSERGNAQYWATNDEQQADSQDINHHVLTLAGGGKLYKAPISKDIKTCLDIGTGTGIWAIDFADEFPDCKIIGTDVSPIQPTWAPPNIRWDIEDCTQEWTFARDSQDFVHMRYLYGSIGNWDALFAEAARVCKPGGWVESVEASPCLESDDGTVKPGSAMAEWGKFYVEGGKIIGHTFEILENNLQEKGMEKAGLVDIQVYNFKVPIGRWPKDPDLNQVGQFAQASAEADYEGYVSFMANLTQGWGREEVLAYCAHIRKEVACGKYHAWYPVRFVWGRKPEA